VAPQLSLLRDVADEIVVGLDTSVEADLAHPLEDVADVLVPYPYAPEEPPLSPAPEPPEFEHVPEGWDRPVPGCDGGTVPHR
jgi:hypothetical protein